MKLKTLKELGINDADISTYERIKNIRNERNKKHCIYSFSDLPMFYLSIFASIIISSFISLFILVTINNNLNIVSAISFNSMPIILEYILVFNMIPIFMFLLFLLCISFYYNGAIRQKEIEKEIYVNEKK